MTNDLLPELADVRVATPPRVLVVAADRIDFAADGIDFANDLIEFWQAALYVRPTSWARCSRMWGGSLHRSRGRGTLRGSGGVSSSAVS